MVMALRLKSRDRQVPNGGPFYCAATGYMAPRFASFWKIVDGVMAARLGNPGKTRQLNLPTDREGVAEEVDLQWATYCHAHKYFDYIDGTPEQRGPVASRPFQQAPQTRPNLGARSRNVVAGAEAIVDWIASGAEAVGSDLAHQRAATCASCPLNERIHSWSDIFTHAVSAGIRSALNWRDQWNLKTPDDEKLGVCSACSCPLKLKIWMPLDRILSKIPPESKDALHPACWILSEPKTLR